MGDTFYMTPQGFPLGFDAGRHPAVGPDSARRSIGKVIADRASPDSSSTAKLACHPTSASLLSTGKCYTGSNHNGCDAEDLSTPAFSHSSPKARYLSRAKSSNRSATSIGRRRIMSRNSSSVGKGSPTDSQKFASKPVVDLANASPREPDLGKMMDCSSSLTSFDSRYAIRSGTTPRENNGGQTSRDEAVSVNEEKKSSGGRPGGTESHGIYLQPNTHKITEEQLVNEVRGIYAGLVMVEKKCIEIDKQQSESPNKLSHLQWQALISLHRTLLHEHHDFFLASQHPSASPVLKRLSEKYAMPARMWRYGIHSFLELLRHRLPDSLEHTLTFLYLAYSMMTLLLESVPAFRETWIECLGDLARYRMAVEEVDLRDREAWAGVARYWYHQAADKNQSVGRIQHHLAVLARPDMLQQLFYYTKSLVSVHPFPSAGESIMLLFHPLLNAPKPYNQPIVASAFVTAHGYLFTQNPTSGLNVSGFKAQVQEFLEHLDMYIGRLGASYRLHGAYMSIANFAAIFQYGVAGAVLPGEFKQDAGQPQPQEAYQTASETWTPVNNPEAIETEFVQHQSSTPSIQLIFYGSLFTFQTLSAILGHIGNKNVYPAVHAYLAFIWCMALNHTSIRLIEAVVPWQKLTTFLNTMIRSDTDLEPIQSDSFPIVEKKYVPEDFLIRGHLWSQQYYPNDFFDKAPTEDDGRSIEYPSLSITRAYRCLWLGTRIAKFNRWITCDSKSGKFSHTQFAMDLDDIAQRLDTDTDTEPEPSTQSDVEMQTS